MGKQKKQMIGILVLLIVFGAAYGGMRFYNKNQEEKANQESEAARVYITEMSQDEITAFSYQNGEDTLEFAKETDTWVSLNDESIELDQTAIETMLGTMATLEAEEVVETSEELSAYGFDAPGNVITITTAEGTTTLTIGMENAVTGQYYLTRNDDNTLYLVGSSFATAFEKGLTELEKAEETTETE